MAAAVLPVFDFLFSLVVVVVVLSICPSPVLGGGGPREVMIPSCCSSPSCSCRDVVVLLVYRAVAGETWIVWLML